MVEGRALPEIKTYYKTYYKNTIVWCSYKNSQTNLWNLTKSPETVPSYMNTWCLTNIPLPSRVKGSIFND